MDNEMTIKHNKPELRQMIAEYAIMFSDDDLKVILTSFGLIAVMLLIYLYGPSTDASKTNIFLSIFAFFNAYFLICFSGLMAFALVSPLLVRVIIPLVIAILEIVRLLLWIPQYVMDALIIGITQNIYYPKSELEETSHHA
jgi:hypothetical protein